MQREIKFRGQRVDTKEWVYGSLLISEPQEKSLEPLHYFVCPLDNGYYRVIPETVGQYTGLKDKNDKEVYEGDVVELTNTYRGANTKTMVTISFENYSFAGKWKEEESPTGYVYNPLGCYNFPTVLIEVIGNIYENPELEVSE